MKAVKAGVLSTPSPQLPSLASMIASHCQAMKFQFYYCFTFPSIFACTNFLFSTTGFCLVSLSGFIGCLRVFVLFLCMICCFLFYYFIFLLAFLLLCPLASICSCPPQSIYICVYMYLLTFAFRQFVCRSSTFNCRKSHRRCSRSC